MKISIFLFGFVLFALTAFGQNANKISGKVVAGDKPLNGATVMLLRAKDSVTLKLSSSSADGNFRFDDLADGGYLIAISAVGHRKAFTPVVTLNQENVNAQLSPVQLIPVSKDLAGVTVTAKRPLIEEKIDRTVVNVEASVTNIGTSALEVLEKSPGVAVDRDGNISLKGKEGVLVMVDGRPTQLSGADLANLLRSMNSSQLDQIEIMTNPPARYDAAGTSGIINIKTKKVVTAGMNGSLNLAYAQGKYPKTNEGFNFNYREGKLNFFANLSHNYQKRFSRINLERNIYNGSGELDKLFEQVGNRIGKGNAYNAKFGADFFATKKTTFGAVVNINSRNLLFVNPNLTEISDAAKSLQSITNATVVTEGKWNSFSSNLNFRTVLDKTGKELTSDIDFVSHKSDNDLLMVNSYTDAAGNPSSPSDSLAGLLPQTIKVYTARVDYLQPIGKNARFEAGIKTGLVNTDNNAVYDSILDGQLVRDLTRSNYFIYKENVNAAYVNLSVPLSKKLSAQLGLRLENTNAQGRQRSTGESFNRHYTQLFPTAFLQYKWNQEHNFGAKIGRRVSRPSYQSLNPFIRFIDRYTYNQGNPALKPSVSNNIELSHSWKSQITTTLNYTLVEDIVQEVIIQNGDEAINMPANVSTLRQFGVAVSANNPFTKWWTNNTSINLYRDSYKGAVGLSDIDLQATSVIINTSQQFKLSKTLTLELNGRYRNGWLEGVLRVKPVGFVGAGISQQILKNKGTIRLTARDIFHTQRLKGRSEYGNVDFRIGQVADTQVLTLGFTYSFSKGKKIAPVKRTAGSAGDEQNRIGGE